MNGDATAWGPVSREQVTVELWAVFRTGHEAGEAPLYVYPTPGQADTAARHHAGGASVARVQMTYLRNRYEGT